MVFHDKDANATTGIVYDLFWRPESARPMVDLLSSLAPPGGAVLDVGAGTGRFALPLARRGHWVRCVEPDPAMRTALVAKLCQEPDLRSQVSVNPFSAETFRAYEHFDFAWCLEVLGYFLTDESMMDVFRNVREHLSSSGRFLFDGADADRVVPHQPEYALASEKELGADRFRMWTRTVRPDDHWCELLIRYELLDSTGGTLRQYHESYSLRTRSRAHLEDLVDAAGLRVCEAFGDVDRRPFEGGEKGLLLVAAR